MADDPLCQFLHEAQRKAVSKLALADLLIMPIQRFPHYILLLERLRSATSAFHPDSGSLDTVMEKVRHSVIFTGRMDTVLCSVL